MVREHPRSRAIMITLQLSQATFVAYEKVFCDHLAFTR